MKGSIEQTIFQVFLGGRGVLYFAIYMFVGCSPCCLICIPQIYGNLCLGWPLFPVLASWSQLNPFCISADGPGERYLGKFCQVNEDTVSALEGLGSAPTENLSPSLVLPMSLSLLPQKMESSLLTLRYLFLYLSSYINYLPLHSTVMCS